MAFKSKYDDIDFVFAQNKQTKEKMDPDWHDQPATTINTALGGQSESSRRNGSSGSSFSGILQDQEVQDTIRAAIDSDGCLFRFGGLLFRGKNSHNCDVLAYAVDNMTREEAQKVGSGRYFDLTTNYGDLFLTYDHSRKIGSHVVFSFRLPRGYYSLRELLDQPKSPECGKIIFRRLVNLLARYEEATKAAGSYQPLCCISLDTVFINRAGNDVKVAPLLARHHDFPPYFPGEAGEDTADQRTDLYTAALTALQFMSGIEMETYDTQMADCSEIPGMDDCLRVFQSRRPDLGTVQALLKQNSFENAGAYSFDSEFFVGVDGEREPRTQKTVNMADFLRKWWPGKKKETATYSGILRDED